MVKCLRYLLIPFFMLVLAFNPARAQSSNFTSGPIPMCDTSVFTANVSGMSQLGYDPWSGGYYYLDNLCINITSNHPQTLVITLTSPQGTTLLLSAYNGAGGSNYTNTCFTDNAWTSITNGTAPFTGSWIPQGGNFYVFDGENPNGIWTITVIDTACAGGGSGPGGLWTAGYFNGGVAGGGIAFGYSGPPPCWNFWFPSEYVYVCPDDTVVDLTSQILWWWWGGYNINIYDSNGQPVADPTSVTPGTYYVDIYDPWYGCFASTYIDVIVQAQAALGPDQNVSICSGSSLNLNTLFPLTGFSTSWTFNGNWINNFTASNASSPGQYQVIAYNMAGCNDTAIVDLAQIPGINFGPDQNITLCGSTPLDLTGIYNTSGLTANWTLNGSSVSNPAAVSTSGTYTLIATDNNGCSDTAQVIFTTTVALALGADTSFAICTGMDVNLLSLYNTGNFQYDWYLNGNVVSTPNSVSTPGNYMLVVTGFPGCSDTAIVEIIQLPGINLGPDQNITSCGSMSLDLTGIYNTSGLTANWTLNWSSVTNPAAVSTSGTYTLIATDNNGCSDTAQVIFTTTIAPSLGPDTSLVICSGMDVNLLNLYNTGIFQYDWYLNGNVVSNPNSVSTPGNYMLVVTGFPGCSDTAIATLSTLPTPSLGPNLNLDVCSNTTLDLGSLFNTGSSNTAWTYNGNPVSNPSQINTSGTYILVATSSGGCTDTAGVLINSLPAPVTGPDHVIDLCDGDSVNLNTLYNTSGYNTLWTSGGIPVVNTSAVSIAGMYQLIATSQDGCSDTALVTVNVNSVPLLGPDQFVDACSNSVIDLTSYFSTSGLTVDWTSGGTPVINPHLITNPGIYTITAGNSAGCSTSANITVNINPAPVLGADQTISFCTGSAVNLNSLFSLTGLASIWTLGGIPVPDPDNATMVGNYQLVATNNNGCSDTAEVMLVLNNLPVIGPDQTIELCPWMSADLSSVFNLAGLTANYFLQNQSINNYTAIQDSGIYTVLVTDNNGCTTSANVIITNITCLCIADFDYTGFCLEDPFTFKIIADSAITKAHWQFNSTNIPDQFILNPQVNFGLSESIVVTLEVTLSCGIVMIQKNIEAENCNCPVFLPGSFTPNSDGINDLFGWYTDCDPENYTMEIYNRVGQVIFQTEDPGTMWNGTFKNEESPAGMYVVKVNYKMPYGKEQQLISQLWLLR